ncbi:MAG: matrixin family metalloprotease [Candidatus Paceibacterota bacterium]
MRYLLMIIIGFVVVSLGTYWLNPYAAVCRLPIIYSIGELDERFGINREQAIEALAKAEDVWEDTIGREDILVYDSEGPFKVNFIYDERQRRAEAALSAESNLNVRGDANEVLTELHKRLVAEYAELDEEYKIESSAYNASLAEYNAEVERHNNAGGASPEVYEELQNRRVELDDQRRELEIMFEQLEDLHRQINAIGEKGNELIGEYNELVQDFNHSFAHGHEYTQGDYRTKEINIYTFTSEEDLALVLAHEMGHALAIGHADDPTAVMYYLMKDQPRPPALAEADKQAFQNACEASFTHKLFSPWRQMYNVLVNN